MQALLEAGYTIILSGCGPAEENITLRDNIIKSVNNGSRYIPSGPGMRCGLLKFSVFLASWLPPTLQVARHMSHVLCSVQLGTYNVQLQHEVTITNPVKEHKPAGNASGSPWTTDLRWARISRGEPMIRYLPIILTLFLLFTPVFSQAAVYQWTDDQGNIGFTDDPDSIPEKYRQNAERMDGKTVPKKPKTNIAPAIPPSTASNGDIHLDDNGRDEQWWRTRMQDLRNRKNELLGEKEKLAAGTNSLGKLGLGSLEANQQAKDTEKQLQQLDSQIKAIEQELTVSIPEEARMANAPPGWLRE
jgi:hypothetical protein